MLAKIISGATVGLSAVPVEVEVDVSSQGLPSITMVGLASKAVDEAKERVRAALKNSSARFPPSRITINLAPADLPKEGPAYDLPLAIGLLIASRQIEADINNTLFFGELSLDGSLRHTKGALPLTLLAKELGCSVIFLPAENAPEASVVSGINVIPVKNLKQLVAHLTQIKLITPQPKSSFSKLIQTNQAEFDFSDVYGQEQAKRALEIAAAGHHNLLMLGTPGSGKTMMARAFAGILPQLTQDEAVEVTKIYSITGNIEANQSIISSRPFRSPHHTTSRIGLIGGGSKPMPGEISLSHHGVLFLDEFPEYPRSVLESLRQPLEDGVVQISRAAGTMRYPAQFLLIAASNPCPCGYFGSKKRQCSCLPAQIIRYQKKISGPIIDRIDLHVNVPEVPIKKLAHAKKSEASHLIRARVQAARDIQIKRYKNEKINTNAYLSSKQIKQYCQLESQAHQLLIRAASTMNLSARAYNKVIKTSRTIADLDNSRIIKTMHLAEALQYRPQPTQNFI